MVFWFFWSQILARGCAKGVELFQLGIHFRPKISINFTLTEVKDSFQTRYRNLLATLSRYCHMHSYMEHLINDTESIPTSSHSHYSNMLRMYDCALTDWYDHTIKCIQGESFLLNDGCPTGSTADKYFLSRSRKHLPLLCVNASISLVKLCHHNPRRTSQHSALSFGWTNKTVWLILVCWNILYKMSKANLGQWKTVLDRERLLISIKFSLSGCKHKIKLHPTFDNHNLSKCEKVMADSYDSIYV